jgi:hypothetical protein
MTSRTAIIDAIETLRKARCTFRVRVAMRLQALRAKTLPPPFSTV